MDTPGIEVRSIPSLIGHGDIHETFFTNVRVPADSRLGEEGQAWSIIGYSLANERTGIPRYELASRVLDEMVGELKRRGQGDDAIVQARAGSVAASCEAARMLVYRTVDMRSRGEAVDAEASLARVAVAEADQAVTEFGMEFLPDTFNGGGHPAFLAHHERAIVTGIAAGATEIQLGLISRRWLGLPNGAA
jgi:alkylation response protein AidB-like acyl-CoA dehydrogenase